MGYETQCALVLPMTGAPGIITDETDIAIVVRLVGRE